MSPRIVNGILSEDEKVDIETAKNTVRFQSRLKCFQVTSGIRPGEFSVIVGKSGNGKSALCKTIGFEAATSKKNVYFLLSEEKSAIYKATLSKAFMEAAPNHCDKFLSGIYFDSMLDWDNGEKTLNFLSGPKKSSKNTQNGLGKDLSRAEPRACFSQKRRIFG